MVFGQFIDITSSDCARIAESLESSLEFFDVKNLPPNSDLGRIKGDLQWAGTHSGPILRSGGAVDVDRARAIRTFLSFDQARRLAATLEHCRCIRGAKDSRNRIRILLRKRLDRMQTQQEEAQDVLFEFDVAGRLYERGVPVEFDEPDLIISLPTTSERIGLPCKRPRTRATILNCVRKGISQSRRASCSHIIVFVSCESILHASSDSARPTISYVSSDPQEFRAGAQRKIDDIVRPLLAPLAKELPRDVLGVVFCSIVTGLVGRTTRAILPGENALYYYWADSIIPNLELGADAGLVDWIRSCVSGRIEGNLEE